MKDLNYYKGTADEGLLKTPISVLRYIGRLELELDRTEVRVLDGIIARTITDQRVIEELETIEAKFPYNCAIEDYGWIWVDLKNRIQELKQD